VASSTKQIEQNQNQCRIEGEGAFSEMISKFNLGLLEKQYQYSAERQATLWQHFCQESHRLPRKYSHIYILTWLLHLIQES
jgi:hypothetical protein